MACNQLEDIPKEIGADNVYIDSKDLLVALDLRVVTLVFLATIQPISIPQRIL